MNNIIDYTLKFFENNPVFNIVAFLLGVSSIISTVYFYFKSKKIKQPTYVVRTINLIKEKFQKIDSVQILYSGERIKDLSITKIALWNDGKDTISLSDVAQIDCLRIEILPEFQILDCEILFTKNEANAFSLVMDTGHKFIDIKFDFFDFAEGVVIQIFHTGNSSDDIVLRGKIKTVKKIKRRMIDSGFLPSSFDKILRGYNISNKLSKKVLAISVIMVGILFLFIPFIDSAPKEVHVRAWYEYCLLTFPSLLYFWLGYRLLRRNIPKGFDVFNDEF